MPVRKRPNIVRQDIGSSVRWGSTFAFGLAAAIGAVIALVAGHYLSQPCRPIPFPSGLNTRFNTAIGSGHWAVQLPAS